MQPRNARRLNEMVCHRRKQQVIQNYSKLFCRSREKIRVTNLNWTFADCTTQKAGTRLRFEIKTSRVHCLPNNLETQSNIVSWFSAHNAVYWDFKLIAKLSSASNNLDPVFVLVSNSLRLKKNQPLKAFIRPLISIDTLQFARLLYF